MTITRRKLSGLLTASVFSGITGTAFGGEVIKLVVSGGAGGAADLAARALAKVLPRYLSGQPTVVVQNMPGAGHVLAANYMAEQAPRDGTCIGCVQNTIPLHQVLDGRGVRFDARAFQWLGAIGESNPMTFSWHTSGFSRIEDVFEREFLVGVIGVGSGSFIFPNAMNLLLGTRFKLVMGYTTTGLLNLAIERGEVQGRVGFSLDGIKQDRPHWLADRKINMLMQVGAQREGEYPDVPLMHELAKTDEQRAILTLLSSPAMLGRPFFAPPGVPEDRIHALRAALAAAAAELALTAIDGNEVAAVVRDTINAPPGIVAQAKAALQVKHDGAKQ